MSNRLIITIAIFGSRVPEKFEIETPDRPIWAHRVNGKMQAHGLRTLWRSIIIGYKHGLIEVDSRKIGDLKPMIEMEIEAHPMREN